MKCNCGKPCTLKANQFYSWDGKYFGGHVCKTCNVVYVDEKDSIYDHEPVYCISKHSVSSCFNELKVV